MRTAAALVGGVIVMLGCQPQPRVAPPGREASQTTLGASSITAPTRAPMSLEEAQRSQGTIAARNLSQKTGIPMEVVSGAAPSWWPVGAVTTGLGRGQAGNLEAAYQAAVKQARGSSVGGLGVSKAAWARLSTGEYVAWVQAGTATAAMHAAPEPAPSTMVMTPPVANTPVQNRPELPRPVATPSAPAPTPPTSTPSDAPSWFTTVAREVDGRVQIGASADATTVKEAPRMAIDAARAALSHVMGKDAADVQLESTFVKKMGEQYRAYVLVSSPGTIKK